MKAKTAILILLARGWRKLRSYSIDLLLLAFTLRDLLPPKSSSNDKGKANSIQHVLIIRLDALGDLIMTTPLLRQLKENIPNCSITMVVRQANREILEQNPFVDRLLSPSSGESVRILKRFRNGMALVRLYRESLRDYRFDLAINPRQGPDHFGANLLLRLAGAKTTIKYVDTSLRGPAKLFDKLAFGFALSLEAPEPTHEVISTLRTLEPIIEVRNHSSPEVFLSERDFELARSLSRTKGPDSLILAIGFGARAPRRKWPVEKWAATINGIGSRVRVDVLLLCAPNERDEGHRLHSKLRVKSQLVGNARIREVAGILKISDLFLGTDSGLAHLAAAMGCPTVVISPHPRGGDPNHHNSPVRVRPFSDRSEVIQPAKACPPCVDACDSIKMHCILQIDPEEVQVACERMLQDHRKNKE